MGHPNILGPMMCVPPDSIPMPYPGHAHYSMMVPLVSHIPGPPLGCPTASMAPTMTPPGASNMTLSNMKPVTSSALPVPSPCSMVSKQTVPCSSQSAIAVSSSKENCNKSEQGEAQSSQPVSPANTPPPGPKAQVLFDQSSHKYSFNLNVSNNLFKLFLSFQISNMKSTGHLPQTQHQLIQQSHLTAPNQPQVPPSSQQAYHLTHNMFFSSSQHQLSSPKTNSTIVNQVQYYPNQIMSVGNYGQHPPSSPHVPSKYPGQWCPAGENLKEVIVREMPNYKANLQDYSPDEVKHVFFLFFFLGGGAFCMFQILTICEVLFS